ncbi:30S ribosomal protein S24e [Methanopyrus sp.]
MEVEILDQRDNPLLYRKEVKFVVRHEDGGTPRKSEILRKLAVILDVDKEVILIDRMESEFGKRETRGYAKIYKSVEHLEDIEPEYMIERHKKLLEELESESEESEESESEDSEEEGE